MSDQVYDQMCVNVLKLFGKRREKSYCGSCGESGQSLLSSQLLVQAPSRGGSVLGGCPSFHETPVVLLTGSIFTQEKENSRLE